jgi:hypothetical protein
MEISDPKRKNGDWDASHVQSGFSQIHGNPCDFHTMEISVIPERNGDYPIGSEIQIQRYEKWRLDASCVQLIFIPMEIPNSEVKETAIVAMSNPIFIPMEIRSQR